MEQCPDQRVSYDLVASAGCGQENAVLWAGAQPKVTVTLLTQEQAVILYFILFPSTLEVGPKAFFTELPPDPFCISFGDSLARQLSRSD